IYDSLERKVQYKSKNYTENRTYDSLGLLVYEISTFNGEKNEYRIERIKNKDELKSIIGYKNNIKEYVVQYKGRKSKTKYLNNNQVDFVKYNGDNKIVRHKTKRKSIDGKWDVWIVRHTYNGDGLIVKSTQTKNGKENSIVNIIYK